MTSKRAGDALTPSVRVAPFGELRAYIVYEYELDELERGSPASLFLNFALFLFGTGITLLVTLLTTRIANDRLFNGFVSACILTLLVGLILGLLWLRSHYSTSGVIVRIRDRMPPSPPIQEAAGGGDGP